MTPLIECVPNISEGRDGAKINAIAHVVETVAGVKLLNIDPGKSTNRTVITFVGNPEAVIEAAFRLVKKAAECIDMRYQKGTHPRMGATDVCPLIPLSGIEMDELVVYAHRLGKRIGDELGIPGYFYEFAALQPKRKNLAYCRKGQYEGLAKLDTDEWKPDFGPAAFTDAVKKTGAIVIGARDFLIAYNINLNTTSTRLAHSIAVEIRESGCLKREGHPLTGKILADTDGNPIRMPGTLKSVKGMGWYIEEYGITQLSLNITNINITPLHIAFDEACAKAQLRGVRVTGSEIIGLLPLKCMLDAADYFLHKQKQSLAISESEKIKIAVKSLGFADLAPFDPNKKIIEYRLHNYPEKKRTIDLSLPDFADEVSADSPAPDGKGVSAYCARLGIALTSMAANPKTQKRGGDAHSAYFFEWVQKGETLKQKLRAAVDADAEAYQALTIAFRMPRRIENEIEKRKIAIANATQKAVMASLDIAQIATDAFDVVEAMINEGSTPSITDGGVGILCLRAAVRAATLNIRINLKEFNDTYFVEKLCGEARKLDGLADAREHELTQRVYAILGV